jgi:hypothetical protein
MKFSPPAILTEFITANVSMMLILAILLQSPSLFAAEEEGLTDRSSVRGTDLFCGTMTPGQRLQALCPDSALISSPTLTVSISAGAIVELTQNFSAKEKKQLFSARLEAAEIATDPDHIEGSGSPNFNRAKETVNKHLNANSTLSTKKLSDQESAELMGHLIYAF